MFRLTVGDYTTMSVQGKQMCYALLVLELGKSFLELFCYPKTGNKDATGYFFEH